MYMHYIGLSSQFEMTAMASTLLLFISPILIHLLVLTIAQPQVLYHICSDTGNYTTNSAYHTNLNHLLPSLSSTQINYGFLNLSYGQNSDTVNAIALCRGDVKPDTCRSCINNSSQELPKLCPSQKEAIIWYDDCMLRYSNRSIFGNMEAGPYFWMYNVNNVSNVDPFNQAVRSLLAGLSSQAAMGDSVHKFAVGNVTTPNNQTIYALVQCTPDLSNMECSDCLTQTARLLPDCCSGRQGGRVITPSCNFRYERELFYDPNVEALPPSTSPLAPPVPSPSSSFSPPPSSNTAATRGTIPPYLIITVTFAVIYCHQHLHLF